MARHLEEQARLEALCASLVDRAKSAGADGAEAVAAWELSSDTRMENNDIHAVQTTDETMFGLRVFKDGALGFITSNKTDEGTLDGCVREALDQAGAMPRDPNNDLPAPQPLTAVEGLFDADTADTTVTETTELASEMLRRVTERDARIRVDSGGVSASLWATALASSTGVAASEFGTSADGHLFGMAVDGDEVASFDYDGDSGHALSAVRPLLDDAVDRFADKCLSGLGAQPGRSFKGAVILSPEVVGEFVLPNLVSTMTADAVRKGRSPIAEKLGEEIAVPEFTLIDDGTRAGATGSSAYDREGMPITRRVLIENGKLQTFLFNHYEAMAAGGPAATTGHASGGASSLPGIAPAQLELAPGEESSESLLAADGPVVYVGRFSGSTNAITGDFSGVVKNGFLIENGERRPIKETLMAGNLFELLRWISAVSSDRRLLGGSKLLPTIRAEGVSITAG